jgi:hypothetical protein
MNNHITWLVAVFFDQMRPGPVGQLKINKLKVQAEQVIRSQNIKHRPGWTYFDFRLWKYFFLNGFELADEGRSSQDPGIG